MADYSSDPHQNPYWQNINGQNQGWDNRQNTRNTDPNWHPEDNLRARLGGTASACGLFALISTLLLPVLLPLPLAGIAIVLAVISKGRGSTYPKKAHRGLWMGIVALLVNCALLIGVLVSAFQMMQDPDYLQEFSETFEDMYGYPAEDFFGDALDSYGITVEEGEGYL